MYGYRQEHNAEIGGLGQTACLKDKAQNHYPQGHAGAVYDGQFLYATYRTADNAFWSNLARESQQEFQRSGTEGKCIEARQEWNRTADMALVSGIEEAKILEIKQTEIHDKVSQSIRKGVWLPNLFRRIVSKAKDFLQNLIREQGMPPKPTLSVNIAEFRTMRNLMIRVQDEARAIRSLQEEIPKRKEQFSEAKGIFKGKKRKSLTGQMQQTEKEISERLDKLAAMVLPIHGGIHIEISVPASL